MKALEEGIPYQTFRTIAFSYFPSDFSSLKSDVNIETAGKLSISSSIVGAIVLIISLAFFYLYLNNVFKIQYPTPPHVGFRETDIIELFRNRTEKSEISMNKLVKALTRKMSRIKKQQKLKVESDWSKEVARNKLTNLPILRRSRHNARKPI